MKIIFLTIIIYAYAYVVLGDRFTTDSTDGEREIDDAIKEKCFENSHDNNSFVNLADAIFNFRECQVQTISEDPPHPVEQHDAFCKYFEECGFYSCLENLADAVLPCLDITETFFPNMILKAYNTTFDKFCGTNKLSDVEYVFNKIEKNRDCLNKAYRMIVSGDSCVQNLTAYKNYNQKIVVDLNQHDYCIDMESFLNCATEVIEQQCDESFAVIKSHISDLTLGVCKIPKHPSYFVRF